MSFDTTFPLVMLAAFGLSNLVLSVGVALLWHSARRPPVRAAAVFGLRLLPATGSAVLVATVILPAFLLYEPRHAHDHPGPLLVACALVALALLGDGVRRGWAAWRSTRALLRGARSVPGRSVAGVPGASVIEVAAPLVAVVGGWRQRIVAAPCVASACDHEEFHQVLAHEAAHRDARDNLKLLALRAAPDALAWLPAGAEMAEHWRSATEWEADERASGADPRKRVALASALLKVARLAMANDGTRTTSRAGAAAGELETRVRRLLAPAPAARRGRSTVRLVACALLVPLLAMPLYAAIHRLIELLVAF